MLTFLFMTGNKAKLQKNPSINVINELKHTTRFWLKTQYIVIFFPCVQSAPFKDSPRGRWRISFHSCRASGTLSLRWSCCSHAIRRSASNGIDCLRPQSLHANDTFQCNLVCLSLPDTRVERFTISWEGMPLRNKRGILTKLCYLFKYGMDIVI